MQRLIDANALDEKLEALKNRYAAQGRTQVAEDYNFVQTVLLAAPTVDAVPVVHGRWISRGKNLGDCSRCGEIVATRHKYCPNCGAKMDLEVDGDG